MPLVANTTLVAGYTVVYDDTLGGVAVVPIDYTTQITNLTANIASLTANVSSLASSMSSANNAALTANVSSLTANVQTLTTNLSANMQSLTANLTSNMQFLTTAVSGNIMSLAANVAVVSNLASGNGIHTISAYSSIGNALTYNLYIKQGQLVIDAADANTSSANQSASQTLLLNAITEMQSVVTPF